MLNYELLAKLSILNSSEFILKWNYFIVEQLVNFQNSFHIFILFSILKDIGTSFLGEYS